MANFRRNRPRKQPRNVMGSAGGSGRPFGPVRETNIADDDTPCDRPRLTTTKKRFGLRVVRRYTILDGTLRESSRDYWYASERARENAARAFHTKAVRQRRMQPAEFELHRLER